MKKSKYKVGKFALRVGKSKTGKGLFAKEEIPKGACIIEYVGRNIKKADQEKANGKYIFETGRGLMIDGNIKKNLARYINHSCAPNCEADGPRGKVFILSLRKIKEGEELTYDYGEEYFDEHIKPKGCLCKKCARTTV
jgi:SET domain-containing protein